MDDSKHETRIDAGQAVFAAGGGWCAIAWSPQGVTLLTLPLPDEDSALSALPAGSPVPRSSPLPSPIASVAESVRQYLADGEVDLSGIRVDLSGLPPFRRKVCEYVRGIPPGQVRTYGQVARAVGSPGAARAVGGAMAGNPVPLLVPCHRVVGANGEMVGFSAPGGTRTKQALLKMERGTLPIV